jgi:multicomponent Na+:H+ antiporter subunit D
MVSSLLNIAYLLPVAVAAFYQPADATMGEEQERAHEDQRTGIQEAPLLCLVPLCLTALGGIVLFFYADSLFAALLPLGAP